MYNGNSTPATSGGTSSPDSVATDISRMSQNGTETMMEDACILDYTYIEWLVEPESKQLTIRSPLISVSAVYHQRYRSLIVRKT